METRSNSKSDLYYHGTSIEVQLGDVVEVARFFKKHSGVVAYIPGISSPRPELEEQGEGDWLIRLERGDFLSMAYVPDNPRAQPRPNIKLIRRGNKGILTPDEKLGDE